LSYRRGDLEFKECVSIIWTISIMWIVLSYLVHNVISRCTYVITFVASYYYEKNAKNGYKSSQNTQKVRPRLSTGKIFMLWTTINTVMIFITITLNYFRGRRRVVLFTKIYAISAYHHPIHISNIKITYIPTKNRDYMVVGFTSTCTISVHHH
jgi:hypothetical protein